MSYLHKITSLVLIIGCVFASDADSLALARRLQDAENQAHRARQQAEEDASLAAALALVGDGACGGVSGGAAASASSADAESIALARRLQDAEDQAHQARRQAEEDAGLAAALALVGDDGAHGAAAAGAAGVYDRLLPPAMVVRLTELTSPLLREAQDKDVHTLAPGIKTMSVEVEEIVTAARTWGVITPTDALARVKVAATDDQRAELDAACAQVSGYMSADVPDAETGERVAHLLSDVVALAKRIDDEGRGRFAYTDEAGKTHTTAAMELLVLKFLENAQTAGGCHTGWAVRLWQLRAQFLVVGAG